VTGRHDELVARLRQAVLSGPGTTDVALRQAVEALAAGAGGRVGAEAGPIPEALAGYVDKVVRHAYQVTDEDVARLRQAGYSEDAIFEITVAAALGAGMGRLERGLRALRGGR
jgi:alkylhydroperoxidase family enzyme